MFFANFVKIDMVKLKKYWELGVLTLGIKRNGHQKNPGNQEIQELEVPGIRRNDCTFLSYFFLKHVMSFFQKYRKIKYLFATYSSFSSNQTVFLFHTWQVVVFPSCQYFYARARGSRHQGEYILVVIVVVVIVFFTCHFLK